MKITRDGQWVQLGVECWRVLRKSYLLVSHQDLFSHLLDLLGFGLNVIFQLILPALNHLQPLYLVLQGLPALLLTHQKQENETWGEANTAIKLEEVEGVEQW